MRRSSDRVYSSQDIVELEMLMANIVVVVPQCQLYKSELDSWMLSAPNLVPNDNSVPVPALKKSIQKSRPIPL